MRTDHSRLPLTYPAVLAAAVVCYAALGAVLSILPRYVPGELGGGPAAVGLAVGAPALTALLMRRWVAGWPIGSARCPPLLTGAGVMAARALPAAATRSLALGPLLATAVGGAAHAGAVLWVAVVLPVLGGGAATVAHRAGGSVHAIVARARLRPWRSCATPLRRASACWRSMLATWRCSRSAPPWRAGTGPGWARSWSPCSRWR